MIRRHGNIEDLAHAFFYKCDTERHYTASASFEDKKFYSYYTCIGYIYNGHGRRVLLVSSETMSATTGKHRSALIHACPFEVLEVPFRYGEHAPHAEKEILKHIAENFASRIKADMEAKHTYTRAADRQYTEELQKNAAAFVELTKVKIKGLAKYTKYAAEHLNADNIKQAAKKARERAAKKAAQVKKRVEQFKKRIAKTPLLESINKYCFDFKAFEATKEEQEERALFVASFGIENPSFVTFDSASDTVKTSQRVTIPTKEVLPLLRAWKHGKNIVGQKCGIYTILENNAQRVKIGCHNIPTENIKALANVLL